MNLKCESYSTFVNNSSHTEFVWHVIQIFRNLEWYGESDMIFYFTSTVVCHTALLHDKPLGPERFFYFNSSRKRRMTVLYIPFYVYHIYRASPIWWQSSSVATYHVLDHPWQHVEFWCNMYNLSCKLVATIFHLMIQNIISQREHELTNLRLYCGCFDIEILWHP